ncbi:hypothetical protein ABKN59_010595 [Abortiporus biennis]
MCKIVAPRMDSLPNPYIHNLIFAHPASKDGDSDIWAFLHLVPSIRVLSLFGLDKENSLSVTSLDPLSSQMQIPFRTLERLSLMKILAEDIPKIIACIKASSRRLAKDGLTLSLTHFKLEVIGGIEDELFDLINALSTSPICYLTLIGIYDIDPTHVEFIADFLPHLVSLTLFNQTWGQITLKPVTWKHPTWAYAAALSRFKQLQHFGWNYCVQFMRISPCVLIELATGQYRKVSSPSLFQGLHPDEVNAPNDRDSLDGDVFGERESVVRLFAAHCPTLTSMSLECQHLKTLYSAVYIIRRSGRGIVEVERGAGYTAYHHNPTPPFSKSWHEM